MSDLNELYQALILDHNAKPRNFGKLEEATHYAEGYNPLCGDQYTVYLALDDDDNIEDVHFEGQGCAISKASASLMTTMLKGKSRSDAEALFDTFHELLTGDVEPDIDALGKLAVFAGVREFPTRVKCATLSWHTVKGALQGNTEMTTE